MKQKQLLLGIAVITAAVSVALYTNFPKSEGASILSSNVAALSSGEFDPIAECELRCKYNMEYDCILYTNYDFTITCDSAIPWM